MVTQIGNFFGNCMTNRVTEMTSFLLHFRMANSNWIACFVGLPSRFFTNYRSISINQVANEASIYTEILEELWLWLCSSYTTRLVLPLILLREFYSMGGLAAVSFYGWGHHTQPLYSSVMPKWDACFVKNWLLAVHFEYFSTWPMNAERSCFLIGHT